MGWVAWSRAVPENLARRPQNRGCRRRPDIVVAKAPLTAEAARHSALLRTNVAQLSYRRSVETHRKYQDSHPFLTFKVPTTYCLLSYKVGEAFSKCQHLIGTPLPPLLAASLGQMYLIKGAQATAAIEGNTLTESQVQEIAEKRSDIPRSQEYMKQEIENILRLLDLIYDEVGTDEVWRLTPEWLRAVNYHLLDGIDCEDHVEPGEFTTAQLTVGNGTYRPVNPADVEYLLDKMCGWLNEMIEFSQSDARDDDRFMQAFHAATLAHLYIAWIHPFGDGNGRTARALEAGFWRTPSSRRGCRVHCYRITTTGPERATTSGWLRRRDPRPT